MSQSSTRQDGRQCCVWPNPKNKDWTVLMYNVQNKADTLFYPTMRLAQQRETPVSNSVRASRWPYTCWTGCTGIPAQFFICHIFSCISHAARRWKLEAVKADFVIGYCVSSQPWISDVTCAEVTGHCLTLICETTGFEKSAFITFRNRWTCFCECWQCESRFTRRKKKIGRVRVRVIVWWMDHTGLKYQNSP